MPAAPELEIFIHEKAEEGYSVQVCFRDPDSDVDNRAEARGVSFDFAALRQDEGAPQEYGRRLGEGLFEQQTLRSGYDQARAAAQSTDRPLRLRLSISASLPELHQIHWETLIDPGSDECLAIDQNILFSRHLSSFDMRPVRLRANSRLRALVVVASPANVSQYKPGGRALAEIDVDGEVARARAGLGEIPVTLLPSDGQRATLENLTALLRDEAHDILYLVCHGAFIDGVTRLWLENDDGEAVVTAGSDLVRSLRALRRLPRLVVLGSCQSAGAGEESRNDDDGVLAALGPRLAEAGVPAVIAMQGNIMMNTVAQFMPEFFRQLQHDGQIDRAMAVARGKVRGRSDWWMPVLFMRLVSGRLWYERGFADEKEGYQRWPALVNQIRAHRCTPILGPGLVEPLIGSPRDLARHWAETYHFPLSARFSEDLPHVAQYLQTVQDWSFPRDELIRYASRGLLDRWPELGRGHAEPGEPSHDMLLRLLSAARAVLQQQAAIEAHQALAELPFPIYITTNYDNLLPDALRQAGKEPHTDVCDWKDAMEPPVDFSPTVERPLVYHLFGHLNDPDSIVLTEDDYFDYLIGYTRLNSRPKPSAVLPTLTNRALMFLGFRLSDWNFRVFFRSLMGKEGRRLRGRYKHVAVQIDPEEGLRTDSARARQYLERYFEDADINIYWGSVEDFVQELHEHWSEQ